jgi:hypothetical protein
MNPGSSFELLPTNNSLSVPFPPAQRLTPLSTSLTLPLHVSPLRAALTKTQPAWHYTRHTLRFTSHRSRATIHVLSPLFPLDTRHSPVSLLFPTDTKNMGVPPRAHSIWPDSALQCAAFIRVSQMRGRSLLAYSQQRLIRSGNFGNSHLSWGETQMK